MIVPYDYHMHTNFSDGRDDHETMIRSAIEKGFREIGFSDHYSVLPVSWTMSGNTLARMVETVHKLRKKYAGEISIKLGLEIDFFPGKEEEIYQHIKELPLDYTIGALHLIDGWKFFSDSSGYDSWDVDKLYEKYYDLIRQMVSCGLFDIIAHFDLIKKIGYYPAGDMRPRYQKLMEIIKEKRAVIEINTNGLNKPCHDYYPCAEIVEVIKSADVPVVLSSDAHSHTQIGQHFEEAYRFVKQFGISNTMRFDQREKFPVPFTV